jgi:hypothetical protein
MHFKGEEERRDLMRATTIQLCEAAKNSRLFIAATEMNFIILIALPLCKVSLSLLSIALCDAI